MINDMLLCRRTNSEMDESKLLLMEARMIVSTNMLRILVLIGVGVVLGGLIPFPLGYLWLNVAKLCFVLRLGFMDSVIISLLICTLCGSFVLSLIRDRIGGRAGFI